MNTIKNYKIALWTSVQKLFKSGGDSLLLLSKVLLAVATLAVSGTSLLAQSSIEIKPVKLLDLPEIKTYEYLPQVVQDMPLELQYFNGKEPVTTSFGALKENFVQLFFWDTSYPEHYADLKRIFEYGEEMGAQSTFMLVVSKSDQATLDGIKADLDRFKKELEVDMDIAFVIGNPNLDKLFKMDVFPKYVQINKDAVFLPEQAAVDLFKMRDRRKTVRNGK
ncbi:hypothetical protein KO02_11480 [Sphingobacterium sp. ML3W]|uniref:hypothetical protein n=1 Tax=Sphingobacterium sp. ML3W TaxID=1538644 RepID=UPI0004F5A50D|nr:hypothetical protein [Sphingobacterium sp. ML3W]AIM37241.1 hypothetical protein KO02_11480 [Sphingobacterium sp. ML3W]